MPVQNSQIADVFDKIADLIDLQEGNQFRIRSYRNAARTVRSLSRSVQQMVDEDEDLTELPYIGESTARKISEIVETGTCERLEKLKEKVPEELTGLMKLPQVGPRKAMQIFQELNVKTLDDLKEAAQDERVRELPGMGEKTEEQILEGLESLEATSERILYKDAADYVESICGYLEEIDSIRRWEVAGSFRRGKETIGDLDILLQAGNREAATGAILEYGSVESVIGRGQERVSVRLDSGLQIDFRFFELESFGSALQYFTGSKAHSVSLRKIAQQRDWKLNEYGLFKGKRRLAGKSEEAVYHRLNLPWIPPELREDRGEIEAAQEDDLPHLIDAGDIRGDLHCHTDSTDGANTLQEMVEAARERGYRYLAITDHSRSVTMAKGLDEKRLKRQAREIRKLNDSLDGFWLLAGIEVDILKDGKLDLEEKVLSGLDWVVASVHYNRNMSKKKMTDRLVSALESGVVHCLGHPLGRIIGRRDPLDFDIEKVFEACSENDVCLEIDAQPDRLDLPDLYCKQGAQAGLSFTVVTDAHKQSDLDLMPLGIKVARRGWLERKDVLNTRTIKQLRKRIAR